MPKKLLQESFCYFLWPKNLSIIKRCINNNFGNQLEIGLISESFIEIFLNNNTQFPIIEQPLIK